MEDAGGAMALSAEGKLEVSLVPTTHVACASPFFPGGAREE